MITRRTLLNSAAGSLLLSASPLLGAQHCATPKSEFAGAIDVHTHVFNGRDIPVVGFLLHTVLRKHHKPPVERPLLNSLLKLVRTILLKDTSTVEQEWARFERGFESIGWKAILGEDEAAVRQGLTLFISGEAPNVEGLESEFGDDLRLINRLADDLHDERDHGFKADQAAAEEQAGYLSKRIYQLIQAANWFTGFRFVSSLIETIRWVALLTRDRMEILTELVRLYGGNERTRVFSPSLVDLDMWLNAGDEVSDIEAQIHLLSRMAQETHQALILPFAPFCPLRAAVVRKAGRDPLTLLNTAIGDLGFVGIKLYPTMGFRPLENDTDDPIVIPKKYRDLITPSDIEAELETLYTWCIANDVPIKAHANNSNAGGACTGLYARPQEWNAVFNRTEFRELRVNLAHFGGFSESLHNNDKKKDHCKAGTNDWENDIADMVDNHPGLYFDLGYWIELADALHKDHGYVSLQAEALFSRVGTLENRVLYGSDWTMIAQEPGHREYFENLRQGLADIGLDGDTNLKAMGGNALRYLGLDRDGPQFRRVADFHGNNRVFQEMFCS